jgi:peptidoglycan/xylan/chitin deacetylase (PgdA/CDA1 family)
MFYPVKTNWLMRALYPSFTWQIPENSRNIYLSFDDGPHPEITPFVLDQLKEYNAKGSFFCIGDNVRKYPATYERIVNEGHTVGNHTQNHLNGWKSTRAEYFENVEAAAVFIDSDLFRPPYGKIKRFQAKQLQESRGLKVIMWSVLSGDFDQTLLPDKCLQNVLLNTHPGSIVVFHDSEKAWKRLAYALPKVLEYFTEKGYFFKKIIL